MFLDFSKAFNSVPHERLLSKLQAYSIRDPLLSWVRSFLTNRHQRVVLREHYSSWTSELSGFPKGKVLGPALFLIYINDITRNIESQCKLFADDMKVYKVQRTVHERFKFTRALEHWMAATFYNTTKYEAMEFKKRITHHVPNIAYVARNWTQYQKQKTLSWRLQVTKLVIKSWGLLSLMTSLGTNIVTVSIKKAIKRLFALRTLKRAGLGTNDLVLVYCSIVRSIVEYASPVWAAIP